MKTFRKIDIYSGTGPDLLASRVLVECSQELSLPLAKLIRRIIALGFVQTARTIHWLMPLYTGKVVSDPENYCAINLTAQISKAVERYLSSKRSTTEETTEQEGAMFGRPATDALARAEPEAAAFHHAEC